MSRTSTLQDPFLNALRKEKIPVSIYLVNGIKLQGNIEAFDQFSIVLRNNVNQMVYKHAVSTIVPSKAVKLVYSNYNQHHQHTSHNQQSHDQSDDLVVDGNSIDDEDFDHVQEDFSEQK